MTEDQKLPESVKEATNGSKSGAQSLLSGLMSKEVVIPAVATAASVVAYAARKGAGEVKEKAEGEAEEIGRHGAEGAKESIKGSGAGGLGAIGKVASKALGGGGGGGGSAKKTRRLPIQRFTDVAVPRETAYKRWTEFEEFPKFMHRVL